MACATTTIAFTGTIVSCESRFRTAATNAFVVDFHANWVVTIDIETAERDAPAPAGQRASFLFHSPAQLFLAAPEQVAGWRCRFTIVRRVVPESDRVDWSALTASRIE